MNRSHFIAAAEQVLARCDALAKFSEHPSQLTRRFLTPAMRAVHGCVGEWMLQAKLVSRVDQVGNLIGTRHAASANQVVLIGSHLDTVPNAGRFDGVMGVMIGIAVAELTADLELPFHLEVIGFSEEEGVRFGLPFIGSSAFVGELQDAWLDRVDSLGLTMRQVVSEFGLLPDRMNEAACDAGEVLAFLETHLEQGPVLWNSGASVGVVSAIVGQTRAKLEFTGHAGHAGTTPMAERRDALVAAAEFVLATREIGQSIAGVRATVGHMLVEPNVANVIPAAVQLTVDIRHSSDTVRADAAKELLSNGERLAAQHGCTLNVVDIIDEPAVRMDDSLTKLLLEATLACGHRDEVLVSGAGHDAMILARRFPAAMMFVRHPGAISHHPDEQVDLDDVVVAIEVACHFVQLLADRVLVEKAKAR